MTVEGDINEEEMSAINEMKTRLNSELDPELFDDDYFFLRFLRAQDLNLNNSEVMIRKYLEYRKKYDIGNILNFKKTEVMEKYISNVLIGYDKEGCVIRYAPVGNLDLLGLLASIKRDDLAKFIIHEIETEIVELKKQSKKLGKNVDQVLYIYNLENFSFAQATDKKVLLFIILFLQIYINNYPERMKAVFIINRPIYFDFIYAVLKSIAPAKILQKIRLFADESYKTELLELIDADVLPKFLGGNKTDPDGNPLCLSMINHGGGRVPDTFYLSKNRQPLSKLPGTKKVTLSRAAFHEVKLEVKEPGSYLEWEFETKCRDIGFGLFYEEVIDGEEKVTELVPIQRIDTDEIAETGTARCEFAGTYVILFDNTYSWVRAKEIYYRTKVVTPKEHEAEVQDV